MTIDGIRVRYIERGRAGTSVLLLHGLGGTLEGWRQSIAPLAASCRVVALDLPGFGASDKPPARYDLGFFARFVDRFMERLGIEGAVVIGHSLGAAIGLELAASFPSRVSRLALLDQGLFSNVFLGGLRLASAPGLGNLSVRAGGRLLPLVLRRLVSDRAMVTRDWVKEQIALNALPGAREALLATMRSLPLRNHEVERMIRTQLAHISVPILVVWGAEDRLIDVNASLQLFAASGNARLQIVGGCGHSPQVERPREVNALLAEFIREAA